MTGETVALVLTGMTVAGSIFKLGWSIRGFRSDLSAIGEAVQTNGDSIKGLDDRMGDVMTKEDCLQRSNLMLKYVNGRPK